MRITKLFKILSVSIIAVSIVGCSTPTTYYWENYEPAVYQHFTKEISTQEQIAVLQKDLAQAKAQNKAVSPGLHAHLGMLYMKTGQESSALAHFSQEKLLFPESAHYIDFLISHKKPAASNAESGSKPVNKKSVK